MVMTTINNGDLGREKPVWEYFFFTNCVNPEGKVRSSQPEAWSQNRLQTMRNALKCQRAGPQSGAAPGLDILGL